jgi:hypothetical protein
MNPANALKIARVASPLGIASLAGEGLYITMVNLQKMK